MAYFSPGKGETEEGETQVQVWFLPSVGVAVSKRWEWRDPAAGIKRR